MNFDEAVETLAHVRAISSRQDINA